MITGVIAFLQALPRLLAIMNRIGIWMTQNNINAFMDLVEAKVDKLEKAKTADEKLNSAQDFANIIRGLS